MNTKTKTGVARSNPCSASLSPLQIRYIFQLSIILSMAFPNYGYWTLMYDIRYAHTKCLFFIKSIISVLL